MDYLDFFDKHKPLVRIKLPSAQVGGRIDIQKDNDDVVSDIYEPQPSSSFVDVDYSKKYKEEEEAECLRYATEASEPAELFRPDSPTTVNTALRDDDLDSVAGSIYSKYKFDRHIQINNLTINSYQEQITNLIATNSVVIIQGPTGCGKTTQVPQYILDYCQSQDKYCKIVVTQPRRIAAISVAKRVSEERGWPISSIVGYHIGLDNQTTEDTLLTYMTTGVLLQKIISSKNLSQYTHIIMDEVHEREAEMDFLLLIVRKYLRTVSRQVKVILMSATFDVEHFSQYFMVPKGAQLIQAPVLDVTKESPYTVNVFYLNQFLHLLVQNEMPDFEEPLFHRTLLPMVAGLVTAFNKFDSPNKNGSVLIFLPGIYEIEEVYRVLMEKNAENKVKWFIVPLHSSITNEEQKKAFMEAPEGHRKIILSTNIAESSITVPDVCYVIDFCLTKILKNDTQTNYNSLQLTWASKTNCEQRAGRVGRVAAGRVYRLVPEQFYNHQMQRDLQPEMLRSPLHRLVLLAKVLELDIPPSGILALAINPPALKNIEQTIALLKEAGAMQITYNGVYDIQDGDLTCIGRIMAQLPFDISVSRLIILGYMFSTLKECVIMAAAISHQNIFSTPFNQRMKAYQSKLSWADCSCSDLIAYLHVYVVWERNKYNNMFKSAGGERAWMKRNFLEPRVMREWKILVQEIKNRLQNLGITEPMHGREGNFTEHEKAMMLKVVISGAFYPNYFVRSSEAGQISESLAVRQLGGRDPYTTVLLSGKPENQPAELYVHFIRDMLKDCGQNMHISHDNTNKIFVQFKHDMIPTNSELGTYSDLIPGKIAIEVYYAVKYRMLKLPTEIRCVSAEEAKLRVKHWKKRQQENKRELDRHILMNSIIPAIDTLAIEIQVSHINNPGHFFAHNVENKEFVHWLNKIERELNTKPLTNVTENVLVGKLYAAPYESAYYRARVIYIEAGGKIQVIFIDYGNIACVQQSDLRHLIPEICNIFPLALECVLTAVKPSHDMNIHALWSRKATAEFERLTKNGTLFGKVFSVVDNVVSLELYAPDNKNKTINQWLVEQGYAKNASESFLSQNDHNKREYAQNNSISSADLASMQIEWHDQSQNEMPTIDRSECRFTMNLKGPSSPLEMKVFSIMQCSLSKTISIEGNSVNSVLLDAEPQDPHDRLLVTASVNQKDDRGLSLRHTTLMPNIHGFTALMALLFCPTMELHTDKDGTRLSSILCGLGYDPATNKSLFPSHDIALSLDFDLTSDDVTKINEIRYFMNMAVHAMNFYWTKTDSQMPIGICQNEIRKAIRGLLREKRRVVDRLVIPSMYQWNKYSRYVELISPQYDDVSDLWSMHSYLKFADSSKIHIQRHLEEMRDVANRTKPMTELTCQLCNIVLYSLVELRVHMISQLHKENEKMSIP